MSWCRDDTHVHVACDHDGCTATFGRREYTPGNELDGIAALIDASEEARRAGWYVPGDDAPDPADRCPAHRPATWQGQCVTVANSADLRGPQ